MSDWVRCGAFSLLFISRYSIATVSNLTATAVFTLTAGFLHTCRILRGCKLDPKLINALVERWRPETHTFHPLCDECTITLEDVTLQLDLPMDGLVIMRAMIVPSKEDLCAALLGKVSNKFKGGQISMNWLEKIFQKLHPHATKVLKEQYTQAFILQFIGGILMPNKS
ncbi:hypothetical protein PVK06_017267 [Gossypium arboreum]|uniref:Aminotransferase-like plant mobile domain-containing protein n=1 Tax=Gossypium arboreum TaxID=29729 RepID=A0ABR0Q307_GOSAR|nr:hypothetical protein PVK06_017267 [Gossypium arboreum]